METQHHRKPMSESTQALCLKQAGIGKEENKLCTFKEEKSNCDLIHRLIKICLRSAKESGLISTAIGSANERLEQPLGCLL